MGAMPVKGREVERAGPGAGGTGGIRSRTVPPQPQKRRQGTVAEQVAGERGPGSPGNHLLAAPLYSVKQEARSEDEGDTTES